jgi:DNA-binding LacI/PurR family transcriptional regulator
MKGPKTQVDAKPSRKHTHRVTLRDLAEHLGLSQTTVSFVLNNSPLASTIAKQTQERIWEAAREMQYRPNIFARYLHTKRTYSVAVLVPDIGDEYSSVLISGIERHLADSGFIYMVLSHRGVPEKMQNLPNTLMDRAVEGLIAINTPLDSPLSMPVVAISDITKGPGITHILIDNTTAAMMALQHLHDLGHKKVAFFKGPEGNGDTDNRWSCLQNASQKAGIAISPQLTVQLGNHPVHDKHTMSEYGYIAARELLERKKEFTAIVAFNDGSAIGAIRALNDAGLRVPQDVSIVGFDDVVQAAYAIPRLTTIRQPLQEMGQIAAKALLDIIHEKKKFPPEIVLQPELVVRESTAPAPQGKKPLTL